MAELPHYFSVAKRKLVLKPHEFLIGYILLNRIWESPGTYLHPDKITLTTVQHSLYGSQNAPSHPAFP